jgi:hypothetical protein
LLAAGHAVPGRGGIPGTDLLDSHPARLRLADAPDDLAAATIAAGLTWIRDEDD